MDKDIAIREYTSKNKSEVINLLRLNTPEFFSRDEEKDLIFYLDHEIDLYFVVVNNLKLVGCGGINLPEDVTTAKISWDIIHPDFQQKGIGSLLLNHRINKLKSLPQIKTIAVRTSQLAYKFYEKNGFKLMEIEKDYWAKGFDLYSMSLLVS